MFAHGLVRRRQIAPGQRAFLTIGLAQRHGEAGLREFLAQIEGVRWFVDIELREDRLNVGTANESFAVEHRNRLAIREDAVVGIGDRGLQRPQLLVIEDCRRGSRLRDRRRS